MAKEQTQPYAGRTFWDFATEISRRFGVGVLILIGVVYGFYKFQEQAGDAEKARQDATRETQKQLNDANQSLRETYVAVGNMHETMIQNVRNGLDALKALQGELARVQQNTAEEAQKADKAIAAQSKAEEAKQRAEQKLQDANKEVEQRQKQYAEKVGPLKEDVKRFVNLVLKNDALAGDSEIATLADEIRSEYLIDPVKLLTAFAENPSAENAQALDELEGLSYKTIHEIAVDNEPGFQVWASVGDPAHPTKLIAVAQSDDHWMKGVVEIWLSDDQEQRVLAAETLRRMCCITFPDRNNWDIEKNAAVVETFDSKYIYFGRVGIVSGVWTITTLWARVWGMSGSSEVKVLSGSDPALQSFDLPTLWKTDHAVAADLKSEMYFAHADSMRRRAEKFSASALIPVRLGDRGGDLGNLRETIVRALDAAVRRDDTKRQALAGASFDQSNWGPLAAVVLHPGFRFEGVSVSLGAREVSVHFVYRNWPGGSEMLGATLVLARAEPSQRDGWRVTGFASHYCHEEPS
ncbi:MAG: hypothetical protein KAV00_06370 [Phycisphaerae bacterium]|nr:hypothetical protein [Phycisphaerae bacterium]